MITLENCNAMAAALLLYYHLAPESGFVAIYIDAGHFSGLRFLNVTVVRELQPAINEGLLREAAVICLLCDLNNFASWNCVMEHADYFQGFTSTQHMMAPHKTGNLSAIMQKNRLFILLKQDESRFDFSAFHNILAAIYSYHVLGTLRQLVEQRFPR